MKDETKKLSIPGLAMALTLGGLTLVAQGCSKRQSTSSSGAAATQHKCGSASCGGGSCGSGACGKSSCGSGGCGSSGCGQNSCG